MKKKEVSALEHCLRTSKRGSRFTNDILKSYPTVVNYLLKKLSKEDIIYMFESEMNTPRRGERTSSTRLEDNKWKKALIFAM